MIESCAIMKNLLIAAGVLLAVLIAVYFATQHKPDPAVQRLADLTELAERTCLSNTSDTSSLTIRSSLEAVRKNVQASAAIDQKRSSVRGAAQALDETLQNTENNQIRTCMEPWAKQIRDMASKM